MQVLQRLFATVATHSRIVIAAMVVLTAVLGAGITQLESGTEFQGYRGDSTAAQKLAYTEANFSAARANASLAQVVVRDENVLDRETLVATLELQLAIRRNETVAPTLVAERPTVGLANAVAIASMRREGVTERPSLSAQLEHLRGMPEPRVERVVRALLVPNASGRRAAVFAFVPGSYEPGTDRTNATMLVVAHERTGPPMEGRAADDVVAAQTAIESLVADDARENAGMAASSFAVGNGVVTAEQRQARRDSMQLVAPLALLLVLLTLVAAYRDVLDVAMGFAGIVLVLVWTFGALGWLGIPFSSLFVAVPVLLVGLSIDYAIHVVMRYREARAEANRSPREAMRVALPGVGTALVLVTLTTAIGFLSHLTGPIGPLRDIGIISAVGIASAFGVFAVFLPAVTVELDSILARLGRPRRTAPIGTAGSRLARVLSVGVRGARRSPNAVLLLVLLVSGGAAVAASDVSTTFQPEDFFPGETPDWMDDLPGNLQPADYDAKADLAVARDRFVDRGTTATVLVEGDVTDPAVLDRLEASRAAAADTPTVDTLATGKAAVRGPTGLLARAARTSPTTRGRLAAADTDGDGLPERNVEAVFAAAARAVPDAAARVLHREDDGTRAVRLVVGVDAGADSQRVRAAMRDFAATVEGPGVTATATGMPVVRATVQDELLRTVVVTLVVTLVAVTLLLMGVYRLAYGSATLGLVTITPVGLTVTWVLGAMWALGLPLSVMTALVASLTVGIGVDYCIHVSERYVQELDGGSSPEAALRDTIAGTGAALLGSAVTTATGFGVLALAVLPSLRQFGVITALTIVFASLAAVLVLPSLLVLWTRYVARPAGIGADRPAGVAAATDDD